MRRYYENIIVALGKTVSLASTVPMRRWGRRWWWRVHGGLSCCGFDHTADNNEKAHSDFIDLLEVAVISPDVGTAGMIFWVSASCYRRLFCCGRSRTFVAGIGGATYNRRPSNSEAIAIRSDYSGSNVIWWLAELIVLLCLPRVLAKKNLLTGSAPGLCCHP